MMRLGLYHETCMFHNLFSSYSCKFFFYLSEIPTFFGLFIDFLFIFLYENC